MGRRGRGREGVYIGVKNSARMLSRFPVYISSYLLLVICRGSARAVALGAYCSPGVDGKTSAGGADVASGDRVRA